VNPKRKLYRVGPNFETWRHTLPENPYESPEVGPQFGPTLYNFRSRSSAPPSSRSRPRLALDVKVILTPLCLFH
jgi:hypothetical protein